jgi:hypothetical protein
MKIRPIIVASSGKVRSCLPLIESQSAKFMFSSMPLVDRYRDVDLPRTCVGS